MEPKLVVFWTLKVRPDWTVKRFSKKRMASEFPADTEPETAINSILKEYGRVTDVTPSGNPYLQHAIIAGHKIIHHHERATVSVWTATEVNLFDETTWDKCKGKRPNVMAVAR